MNACHFCFSAPTSLCQSNFIAFHPFSSAVSSRILPSHNYKQHRATTRLITTTSQYSSSFPQPDAFAFPFLAFPPPPSTLPFNLNLIASFQPELLGSVLWFLGIYLGFSEKVRWSTAFRELLYDKLVSTFPAISGTIISFFVDAIHWIPFFAAALLIDASLRYTASGNAVYAISTGVSIALYGGIFELARQSVNNRFILSKEDQDYYDAFQTFATKWLQPKGRCHFIDIKAAVKRDTSAPVILRRLSDEKIRKFVMNYFPKAKRSPNGYYRGLSIRTKAFIETNENGSDSPPQTLPSSPSSSSSSTSSSSSSPNSS